MRYLWPMAVVAVVVWGGSVATRQHSDQHDTVRVARCAAKCWSATKKEDDSCVTACLAEKDAKPGTCPDAATLSVFEAACVDVCQSDVECPATDKCCSHTCGVTCQPPYGLDKVPGLPSIPANLSALERRRGRQVLVEWSGEEPSASTPVVYLLEERHHVGRHYAASRLGDWTQRHRPTPRAHVVLKHVLRPGRWYQFRVAAVNERGTRGFSEASAPFTLSVVPKAPRPPEKLAVRSLTKLNGSYYGELTWEAPTSDLPIQRYKVYWSRQLQGAAGPLVSVLVKHQTVAKDVTSFALKQLEPDAMYFLQVQALSQFGRDRLKGEKTALVINTTMQSSAPSSLPSESGSKRSVGRVANLRVLRMFWRHGQLLARISWLPLEGQKSRYMVTWWQGSCQGGGGGGKRSKKVQLAATTESPHFDVYNLSFRCKYRVTVRRHGSGQQQDAMLAFVTPTCEQFASSIKNAEKPTCPIHTEDKL